MSHDELVTEAKKAIRKVFGDASVSPSTTKESLEDIKGEIEICIDSIED
jgi:hypothetical protein